jgi:hypothetical protein
MPKTTVSRPSVKPRTTPQKTTTKRARKQLTSGPTHSRHVATVHSERQAVKAVANRQWKVASATRRNARTAQITMTFVEHSVCTWHRHCARGSRPKDGDRTCKRCGL